MLGPAAIKTQPMVLGLAASRTYQTALGPTPSKTQHFNFFFSYLFIFHTVTSK